MPVKPLAHPTSLQRTVVLDIRDSCPTLVRSCIDQMTQKSHLWSGKTPVCAVQPVVVQCKAHYTKKTEKSRKGGKRQDMFPFCETACEINCILPLSFGTLPATLQALKAEHPVIFCPTSLSFSSIKTACLDLLCRLITSLFQ